METEPFAGGGGGGGAESGNGGVMEPKQAEAADRLSSLPAELRDQILVRLDLRDAVRTSVLSRTWRHLWKSLSTISLSFPLGTHPSVVDSVLLRYVGPRVSLFDIYVDEACEGRIKDWLVALSRRRVESSDMRGRLRSADYLYLPSSIFSFGDLVSLRLERCNIPSLPLGFVVFPALQELGLNSVAFPGWGNQLEAIIRGSPLLRVLDMFHVFIPEGVPESVIEAPNLRSLTISSEFDYVWRIGELPCLEDADIHVSLGPRIEQDYGDFLARFANVQKLTLFLPADVEMPYALPFTFHNLKNLELCTYFTEMEPILSMFTLLRSCHNLKNLEIELLDNVDESFEVDWEFLNAQWTDGMCANLQIVRMIGIAWFPNEISFMKLMLYKARLLRTLYVDRHPDDFDDPLVDLLKCKRASAQARVLFEGLVQQY